MTTLTLSKDRKVANAVTRNGKQASIANTIGLPSGANYSCLGQTDFCALICYAGKLEKLFKGVSAVLERNWQLLKDADYDTTVQLLTDAVAGFVAESRKRNAPLRFRIHWDGDFFSGVYTAAWATVIAAFPEVQFWAYTRVAPFALFLHSKKLANLALYFSADPENVAVARTLSAKGIRIAYVGKTFADGKDAFPSAARCPENNGAIELINADGSACSRCGLCVNGRKDVLFSSSKK